MPLYRSPQEAMQAPAEEFLYLACLRDEAPDFLAVVDTEDGGIIHEMPMPNPGDELHHFGWNRCSSACHGPDRSHLVVPGFRSSRFHIVNVGDDPRRPRIEKVIEPDEVVAATGYTRPHTVHCMPGDNIVVSMLGDADGNGAGGFAVLDAQTFELKGRWENGGAVPGLNSDFWYQPRKNVLVSSESASRTHTSRASTSPTSRPAATGSGSTSGTWRRGSSSRPSISVRRASSRSSSDGSMTRTPKKGSPPPRSPVWCGTSTGTDRGQPSR
jgi:hypothetical protein